MQSLLNICSNILLYSDINLSSIKSIPLGKDIILERFERKLYIIYDEHSYEVYKKYNLIDGYKQDKQYKLIDDELDIFLHKFGIDMNCIDKYGNYMFKRKYDIITDIRDFILYNNIIVINTTYECSKEINLYISNNKIVKKNTIKSILQLEKTKTIYFMIKSSKTIYRLFYTKYKDAHESYSTLCLTTKYSRIVDALIDI